MPNTRREREQLFPYDHELERILCNMGINDDDPNQNIPPPVDVHGQLFPDAPGEHQQKGQNPPPRPQAYKEDMIT